MLAFKIASITVLIHILPLQIWNWTMQSRKWLKLGRTSSLKRDVIWSNISCSSRSHLLQRRCSNDFGTSPRWKTPHLFQATCASTWFPHKEKVFPDIQKEPAGSQFMPITLFPPSLQVFKHISKIPLSLLSGQGSFASLSQLFLTAETIQSLPSSSLNLSLNSLQYVHVFLVLGSPEVGTPLQLWPHHCWVEGKDLPHPTGSTSPSAAKDTSNLLGCKGCYGTLLAKIHN